MLFWVNKDKKNPQLLLYLFPPSTAPHGLPSYLSPMIFAGRSKQIPLHVLFLLLLLLSKWTYTDSKTQGWWLCTDVSLSLRVVFLQHCGAGCLGSRAEGQWVSSKKQNRTTTEIYWVWPAKHSLSTHNESLDDMRHRYKLFFFSIHNTPDFSFYFINL